MSEQKTNYMAELNLWSDANVIGPLFTAAQAYDEQHSEEWDKTVDQVMGAIRAKVLESYHNGLKAKPTAWANRPRTGYQPRRQVSQDH